MQLRSIPIDQNRMETTLHGAPGFPLAVYHSVMSGNVLGYINWHWHEEMQFCRVTRGAVRIFVNEKQYLLREGEGIFINSGYLHMTRPEGDPDSAYICLDAAPRLLAGFAGSAMEEKYLQPYLRDPALADLVLRPEVPWQAQVLEGVRTIYELSEENDFGYELETCALLNRMWLTLLRNRPVQAGRPRTRYESNAAVQGMLTYIGQHYAERLTVEDIARSVSFSAAECCRMFKRVTGETIFTYLKNYRLARGRTLLRETDLPVSRIAYEVGFCSTSYFIEVFKASFAMTPLQYRKGGGA